MTWATGFIGSHLLEKLIEDDFFVYILVRDGSSFEKISHIPAEKYAIIFEYDCEKIFWEQDIFWIIHLATCYKKNHSWADISEMIRVNIELPTKILQLCISYKVWFFINTGSFFEYDFSDAPLSENSREKAFNLYAATKISFQNILKFYSENYNIKTLTLRLFSPYGPRDNIKFIPTVIEKLHDWTKMYVENKFQKLHFTYVTDIIEAYILSIKYLQQTNNKYTIFNIAPENTYSLEEIIQKLEKISWKKIQVIYGIWKENDIWHSSNNHQKSKNILWWKAKIKILEWLEKTYQYFNR